MKKWPEFRTKSSNSCQMFHKNIAHAILVAQVSWPNDLGFTRYTCKMVKWLRI